MAGVNSIATVCRVVAALQEWGMHPVDIPRWMLKAALAGVGEVFGQTVFDGRKTVSLDEALLILCLAADVLDDRAPR